jgi:hypothetical protein
VLEKPGKSDSILAKLVASTAGDSHRLSWRNSSRGHWPKSSLVSGETHRVNYESTPYQALPGCRPTAKWQYRQKLRQILRQIVRRKGSKNASSLRAILLITTVLQALHVPC